MNETIRLMKSHFSVRRFKEEAIKEADLKGNFISWADGIKLEKLSVLFCYCGQKQGKERSSLRLSSSRSDSPISRLSPLLGI